MQPKAQVEQQQQLTPKPTRAPSPSPPPPPKITKLVLQTETVTAKDLSHLLGVRIVDVRRNLMHAA
jgi:hypothetical protein